MLHEVIRSELLSWPGVEEKRNRFGTELAYFLNGREFAHFHSESQLDVRIRAIADGKHVIENPFSGEWVIVNFSDEQSAIRTIELLRRAYENAL